MPHDDAQSSINRDLLDGYARRFGAPFVVQMIDLFVTESPARLVAAKHGLAAGDAAAIGAAAHGLKSSAGNLGAITLMNRMAEIELAVREGRATSVLAPMVASMAEELGRARESLLRLRAELAP
jgi:HPt (histidine-containing phosphotransfer) domain-containing protein